MKNKPFCCCWDLEGPISVTDFAAELAGKLNEKSNFNLHKYNISQFYTMISNYDDYIIDTPGVRESLNIPDYQPGDTLRLMAPLYISCFKDSEIVNFAKKKIGLMPSCKELMKILHKNWDIFIISTSYSQFAYTVAEELNIPSIFDSNFAIFTTFKRKTDFRLPSKPCSSNPLRAPIIYQLSVSESPHTDTPPL